MSTESCCCSFTIQLTQRSGVAGYNTSGNVTFVRGTELASGNGVGITRGPTIRCYHDPLVAIQFYCSFKHFASIAMSYIVIYHLNVTVNHVHKGNICQHLFEILS